MRDASEQFWTEVERRLASERELWKPLVEELLRPDGGPDAVKVFLETEQQRLQQRIDDRLTEVNELVET